MQLNQVVGTFSSEHMTIERKERMEDGENEQGREMNGRKDKDNEDNSECLQLQKATANKWVPPQSYISPIVTC